MPIISGGAAGNTTAQVVASGTVLPSARPLGATVDTTTYDNPAGGGGKLTTLVFPAATASVLATAVTGDSFPRALFLADPRTGLVCFSGGNIEPYASGAAIYSLGGAGGSGIAIDASAGSSGDVRVKCGAGRNVDLQGGPTFVVAATDATQIPQVGQLSPLFTITSGALPTLTISTTVGRQVSTTRDAETITPVTFNPTAGAAATCVVALSPDNVTYSNLGTATEPAGVALDGTIMLINVRVPAAWYVKLTVTNATIGTTTYY